MAEQLSLRKNNNVSYCDSRESWRPTRVSPVLKKVSWKSKDLRLREILQVIG